MDVGGTLIKDGVVFPLDVLGHGELLAIREHFDGIERDRGRFGVQTMNLHLTDPVPWGVAHHPRILEHVSRATGIAADKLWILATTVFCKHPTEDATGAVVGWHQDVTYWAIEPQRAWTAWLAVDDVTVQNGALSFCTGQYEQRPLVHVANPDDATSALIAKQIIPREHIDAGRVVPAPIMAGQMSLHDGWVPHTPQPNYSTGRRLGYVINFVEKGTALGPFEYKKDAEWRKPVEPLTACACF